MVGRTSLAEEQIVSDKFRAYMTFDMSAPFGFEVGFKDKEHKGLGRWFCRDHRPNSNDKGEVQDGLVFR